MEHTVSACDKPAYQRTLLDERTRIRVQICTTSMGFMISENETVVYQLTCQIAQIR